MWLEDTQGWVPPGGCPQPSRGRISDLRTFLDFGHQGHLQWSWWGHHLGVRKIGSPCFCGQPRTEVTPEDRFLCSRMCSRAQRQLLCCVHVVFMAAIPGSGCRRHARLLGCLPAERCVLVQCHLPSWEEV